MLSKYSTLTQKPHHKSRRDFRCKFAPPIRTANMLVKYAINMIVSKLIVSQPFLSTTQN